MTVIVSTPADCTKFFEGGGSQVFSSKRLYQRGGNSIFSRLLNFALPYIKKLGLYTASRAADVVGDTVTGINKGESFKNSISAGVKRAVDQSKQDLKKTLSGGGTCKKKISKIKYTDILG